MGTRRETRKLDEVKHLSYLSCDSNLPWTACFAHLGGNNVANSKRMNAKRPKRILVVSSLICMEIPTSYAIVTYLAMLVFISELDVALSIRGASMLVGLHI